MKRITPYLLAAILLISAVAHIVNPDFYAPMIPHFLPVGLSNILTAVVEGLIGILLILPQYRSLGGLGFMWLMIAFLPIHIWDLFKEHPAVGSQTAAIIRLVFQFVLIYAGWWVFQHFKTKQQLK